MNQFPFSSLNDSSQILSDGAKLLKTVDMHTEGEPLRVVIDGYPEIQGNSLLEYRNYLKNNLDNYRTSLMFEPRGHADMYGCLVVPAFHEEADFGVLFMHNEGYSTMCGHATLALAKLAVQLGWVSNDGPITRFKIEAPCGLLNCRVELEELEVKKVSFENVPSFVCTKDQVIDIPEIGPIKYDIAYGGAFYAFVDADELDLRMIPENSLRFIELGKTIKSAVVASRSMDILHPYEPDLSFMYGVIFTGKPEDDNNYSRNVCVFAEGEVDRSPTGSGVSARLAIESEKGRIKEGDWVTIESILGTSFDCKFKNTDDFGGHPAVLPTVSGQSFITGIHEFIIDPKDPLKDGFILR